MIKDGTLTVSYFGRNVRINYADVQRVAETGYKPNPDTKSNLPGVEIEQGEAA